MELTVENRETRLVMGFKMYVLRTDRMEIGIVPELGARILSLKDRRTGREWMWHPGNDLNLFRNSAGDDFSLSTLAGADECLPTIAPCTWKGRQLPDHGEVWNTAWELDCEAWAAGILSTSIDLPISPLRFERSIQVQDNEARLGYVLTNLGHAEEKFLWALHPLLRLEKGDRLVVPASTRALLNGGSWVDEVTSVMPKDGCAKAFAAPLREGLAEIQNSSTGDGFSLDWNPAENDTLGIWLTRGGWHGYHHFAMEPTNGAPDPLAEAAEASRCGSLAPGESRSWNIRIRIGLT